MNDRASEDGPDNGRDGSWPLVPIRSLGPAHRGRILRHLQALPPHDRYMRFGYAATDEQIQRYVDGIDFDRDDVFGIHNRRLELLAVAHLAFAATPEAPACAEFGVSVLPRARGRGWGRRMFDRAVLHARNEGIELLFIHALSENAAMLHIARAAGARLEREGSETEAYLRLPPATLDSQMSEMVGEQFARTDYRLKLQARAFSRLLGIMQEVRQGVRDARRRSAS